MARLLIATVGTSLLTNRDGRPWTWSPRNEDPLPDPNIVNSWLADADPVTLQIRVIRVIHYNL